MMDCEEKQKTCGGEERTTCKTTVEQLHTRPIEELLTYQRDVFYHIRLNLAHEYYPKTSRMYHIKNQS